MRGNTLGGISVGVLYMAVSKLWVDAQSSQLHHFHCHLLLAVETWGDNQTGDQARYVCC
jgi:hypothetical protein